MLIYLTKGCVHGHVLSFEVILVFVLLLFYVVVYFRGRSNDNKLMSKQVLSAQTKHI